MTGAALDGPAASYLRAVAFAEAAAAADNRRHAIAAAPAQGKRTTAATAAASATKRPAAPSRHPSVDASQLVVQDDVPLAPLPQEPRVSMWQPVLDLLTGPGQSVLVPGAWHTGLRMAAHKAKKASDGAVVYRVAKVSDTQARVWRVL